MPFDGITLHAMVRELSECLLGGRVDRVTQPERDELILTIRNHGQNYLLLLSASADCARAHITSSKKTGPLEPPSLCTLMRKYSVGGKVVSIEQMHCDRILSIGIEHYDELGDRSTKRLVCEFMGKHSNLIYIGADGRIIDSARRVSEAMSSVREVLPGLRYEDPPAHGKLDFLATDVPSLSARLAGRSGAWWKLLTGSVSGLSQQAAREIAFRVTGNDESHSDEYPMEAFVPAAVDALNEMLASNAPNLLLDASGRSVDFAAYPSLSRPDLNAVRTPTLSEALDRYYFTRDQQDRIRQKSAAIHRALKTNIERCERKLALQREALLGSQRMDEYRLSGELLTANLHLAQKGDRFVDLPNYYEEGMPTFRVALDEKLSPSQNAQRYFKLYQKARSAQTLAAEQIEKTEAELNYLEGQMDNLGKCREEAELSEIREELERFGYVRANRNRRQMKQLAPSQPMKFTLPSGTVVLVGKNNLQNDKLTASAQPGEIWLHAKDMPGSHAIIVGEHPSDEDILAAARLAAAYSKGANSSQVPVDYTLKKYVRKPSGARPGFVIYTHQHTLYVQPAERPQT